MIRGFCHYGMAHSLVAVRGTTSRYGGQLRTHLIRNRRQPKRGGSAAWGLGEVLIIPNHKSS